MKSTWFCLPCDWGMRSGSPSSPYTISYWHAWWWWGCDDADVNMEDSDYGGHLFKLVEGSSWLIGARLNISRLCLKVIIILWYDDNDDDDHDDDDDDDHDDDDDDCLHVLPHPGSLQLSDDKIHRLVLQLTLEVLLNIWSLSLWSSLPWPSLYYEIFLLLISSTWKF